MAGNDGASQSMIIVPDLGLPHFSTLRSLKQRGTKPARAAKIQTGEESFIDLVTHLHLIGNFADILTGLVVLQQRRSIHLIQ